MTIISSYDGKLNAAISNVYSVEEVNFRNNQIIEQIWIQKKELNLANSAKIEEQKKMSLLQKKESDIYSIFIYFTVIGLSTCQTRFEHSKKALSKQDVSERELNFIGKGFSVSDILDSLSKIKSHLNSIEERKPFLESILDSPSFQEVVKSPILNELKDVFNVIFKLNNNFEDLTSQIHELEQKVNHNNIFRERGVARIINKADTFALSIKHDIQSFEQKYFDRFGKHPSLAKIAKSLNESGIQTPTEDGKWYPMTVKLVKERIKKIHDSNLLNR